MPVDFAKKLAAKLIEEPLDEITVDVHNDGFSDRVAEALVELGYSVERNRHRPHRLTIRKLV